MGKFCDIQSRNELADYLKIPRKKLSYLLYILTPDKCYHSFEIPKKSGGTRQIFAPNNDLKQVQTALANVLYAYQREYRESEKIEQKVSHAFEKGKNIVTNSIIHKNKRYVLNIDLEDYFGSFHIGRIIGYFENNRHFRFPHEVAVTIAQIACYQGKLPQGSPCSPVITNLIGENLDVKLLRLSKKYRLDYTRYADDITFSTNCADFVTKQQEFMDELASVIKSAGFTINPQKTRLQYKSSQQKVTGLVVNQKVNIDHTYYRETKAMAYHQYTEGSFKIGEMDGTLNQLEGRFAFINQIDKFNNKKDGQKHSVYSLNGRERQYQAFLFYRYFFCAEKPIIITEGKTDVLYLKAALKKMCKEYPNLIERDNEGKYHYKVSFFTRSKKWEYFFGMSTDGADTITNLYRFYLPERNTANLLETFQKLTGKNPKNPVIFLFDNEAQTKDKPLKKFLSDKTITTSMEDILQEDLRVELIDGAKVFLMTTPLQDGGKDSEIEDLLPKEVLEMKIEGRTFDRSGKKDKNAFYNKDILSRHVYRMYESIDLSNFKKVLDTLDAIVETKSAECVGV
jgi:hypothetical protein